MGKNINQITTAVPSILSTDKLYLGRSPFGVTDDRYILGSSIIAQLLAQSGNLSVHTACEYASTGAYTATYANGAAGVGATLTNAGAMAAFDIDGSVALVGERVLIKNQASTLQNGIYTVTTVGDGVTNWVLTRATDFDSNAFNEIQNGAIVPISSGAVNTNFRYIFITSGAVTVGTTAIEFIIDVGSLGIQGANSVAITGGTALLTSLGFTSTSAAGLTLNNLTTLQIAALTAAQGNLVSDSDIDRPQYYDSTAWESLAFLTDVLAVPNYFDCTVAATGADYTGIAQAFTAGKFRPLVIGNTTESANYTFTAGVNFAAVTVLPNVIIDYGDFSPYITDGASTIQYLSITGGEHVTSINLNPAGWINFAVIVPTFILEKCIVDFSAATDGAQIINNTTSISQNAYAFINDVDIRCADAFTTRSINIYNGDINGLVITANGAGGSEGVLLYNSASTNIVLAGSWNVDGLYTYSSLKIQGGQTSNININSSTGVQILATNFGNEACLINNITDNGHASRIGFDIKVNIENISLPSSTIDFLNSGSGGIYNVTNGSLNDVTYAATLTDVKMSNLTTVAFAAISGTAGKFAFSDITLAGAFNIADVTNARFIGVRTGAGDTFTIQASATNTFIDGCQIGAAISDSGVNTTLGVNPTLA